MRWRLLTHETLSVSLAELDTQWCLDDVLKAHDVLDAIEAAQARMRAEAKHGR